MDSIVKVAIAAFLLGLGFGWLLTDKLTPPCSQYEQGAMDSLQLLRGQLRADSVELARRAERITFVIDSTVASIKSIPQQVQDAYKLSRAMSPDSLARRLRTAPPSLRTGSAVAPVDQR